MRDSTDQLLAVNHTVAHVQLIHVSDIVPVGQLKMTLSFAKRAAFVLLYFLKETL